MSEIYDEQIRLFAEVAVDSSSLSGGDSVFTYDVPVGRFEELRVGQLVWVPLRKKVTLGIVVELHRRVPEFALRSIVATVEPTFCLSEDQLELSRWLARETACSPFSAASPFFPPGVTHRSVQQVRLVVLPDELPEGLTTSEQRIVDALIARGETTVERLKKVGGRQAASAIASLERAGLVEQFVAVVDRVPQRQFERYVTLVSPDFESVARAPRQRAVIEALVQKQRLDPDQGELRVALDELLGASGVDLSTIGALERKGLLQIIEVPREQVANQSRGAPPPVLTASQSRAWRVIENALQNEDTTPILLHGVTGSGKTELYLRAAAWCLRHGLGAIILVPEITLATQMVRRFQMRFPSQVRVLHSEMTDSARYATWTEIAEGAAPIVVGPRSALFAPVRDLGLIVLDEEHEQAYKQESDPRYHTRPLAMQLAHQQRAVVLLGSATPSIESYQAALEGQIRLVDLPDRVATSAGGVDAPKAPESSLPAVNVVDMRVELQQGSSPIISEPLRLLIERTLRRREQGILLLNRRGMSTVVLCRQCGHTIDCPHCDVPMIFHADRDRLLCHRCDAKRHPVKVCPLCEGTLDYFGAGTQRVEREARAIFPTARIGRLDRDSVRRQGGHEAIVAAIERREVDLVVGTQMVAKGFDFPFVTAVGVIQADTVLHLPDFRSGERTFQLLTQVAGRAGRRHLSGEVVIQTYTPRHYAIEAAARHDYDGFYDDEIAFREENRYPPFSRLAKYSYRHQSEHACSTESDQMAMDLSRHLFELGVEGDLLGPAPAFAAKVRDRYQWQIVLRTDVDVFDLILEGIPVRPGWTVDIDPQSLL
jgi:primosomal protein N' (replication factor Y) (superfamily II helicase)